MQVTWKQVIWWLMAWPGSTQLFLKGQNSPLKALPLFLPFVKRLEGWHWQYHHVCLEIATESIHFLKLRALFQLFRGFIPPVIFLSFQIFLQTSNGGEVGL